MARSASVKRKRATVGEDATGIQEWKACPFDIQISCLNARQYAEQFPCRVDVGVGNPELIQLGDFGPGRINDVHNGHLGVQRTKGFPLESLERLGELGIELAPFNEPKGEDSPSRPLDPEGGLLRWTLLRQHQRGPEGRASQRDGPPRTADTGDSKHKGVVRVNEEGEYLV